MFWCVPLLCICSHMYGGRELLSSEKDDLIQLPSDKALLTDPVFRPLVEKYAAVCTLIWSFFFFLLSSCIMCVILIRRPHPQDEDAFFADYAEAHLKLSELGYASKRFLINKCRSYGSSWLLPCVCFRFQICGGLDRPSIHEVTSVSIFPINISEC